MQSTIEAFEQWLFEEGRAPRTIESYVSDVKGFQLFLKEKAVGEEQPLSRFSFVHFKEQPTTKELCGGYYQQEGKQSKSGQRFSKNHRFTRRDDCHLEEK